MMPHLTMEIIPGQDRKGHFFKIKATELFVGLFNAYFWEQLVNSKLLSQRFYF